jgi:hypothetical protein
LSAFETCNTTDSTGRLSRFDWIAEDQRQQTYLNSEHREVISITRKNTHAGLILFDPFYSSAYKPEFDLVITREMHPEEWLRGIAAVIEQSRGLNERSRVIRAQSAQLIRDCELVREECIFQRERFAREQAKAKRIVENIEKKSDPSDK